MITSYINLVKNTYYTVPYVPYVFCESYPFLKGVGVGMGVGGGGGGGGWGWGWGGWGGGVGLGLLLVWGRA